MNMLIQSVEFIDDIDNKRIMKKLERIGRVCYKSEKNITDESANLFIANIIDKGHESVIEHESITVRAITSRSVSHQLIRHRIASYSQESQRYVKYNNVSFIIPTGLDKKSYDIWKMSMLRSEQDYLRMIRAGAKPELAREVLPNSTATEIVITLNLRSWRHFLKLRTGKGADPKIKELANLILDRFKLELPVIVGDIK